MRAAAALGLSLTLAGCAHGSSMQSFEGLAELRPRVSMDLAAAIDSRVPAGVSFRVSGPPRRVGQRIELDGVLENAAEEPATVTIFPVGADGFTLALAPGQRFARRPRAGPPLPPPVPPPPLLVDLPPRSRVTLRTQFALEEWDLPPGAELELEWTFQFWSEPKPRGTVRLRL